LPAKICIRVPTSFNKAEDNINGHVVAMLASRFCKGVFGFVECLAAFVGELVRLKAACPGYCVEYRSSWTRFTPVPLAREDAAVEEHLLGLNSADVPFCGLTLRKSAQTAARNPAPSVTA